MLKAGANWEVISQMMSYISDKAAQVGLTAGDGSAQLEMVNRQGAGQCCPAAEQRQLSGWRRAAAAAAVAAEVPVAACRRWRAWRLTLLPARQAMPPHSPSPSSPPCWAARAARWGGGCGGRHEQQPAEHGRTTAVAAAKHRPSRGPHSSIPAPIAPHAPSSPSRSRPWMRCAPPPRRAPTRSSAWASTYQRCAGPAC